MSLAASPDHGEHRRTMTADDLHEPSIDIPSAKENRCLSLAASPNHDALRSGTEATSKNGSKSSARKAHPGAASCFKSH